VTKRHGTKSDTYGPTFKGFLVFDASGRYSIIFVAGNLRRFEGESRSKGTADENKAVVAGSLAHFGTYVVNETDKSFTFQVARATFPNWEGQSLKRSLVITGDVLRFTDPHASAGGVATHNIRAREVGCAFFGRAAVQREWLLPINPVQHLT
jgi:hypothetical protein